jgi:DNA replication protein DnaC
MRTVAEVDTFYQKAVEAYEDEARASYYSACYEACLPKAFWDRTGADVKRNKRAFKLVVLAYIKRWKVALNNGYGLIFCGDNGTGKTLFLSFILAQMIKRECTVYYTSLAQLDVDLKSGFTDNKRARRLEKLLDCDFLALDEMGKEHVKDNSYLRSRLELLLKTRFDNGDPTLLGTNLDLDTLEEHYGSSITSMLRGKYTLVPLICADFREKEAARMKEKMGLL